MKRLTILMRLPRRLNAVRLLALLTCLALVGAPGRADDRDIGPVNEQESGEDGDETSGDETSGDETVGTLPSVQDDTPPPGPIDGRDDLGGPGRSGDGGLVVEGSAGAVLDFLRRVRANGPVGVQLDDAGRARAVLFGQARLRLRPEALAALDLQLSLTSAHGLDLNVLWNDRTNPVHLDGGQALALPLAELAGSPALSRSPLTIDSINGFGTATRVDLRLDDQGRVVLTQARF